MRVQSPPLECLKPPHGFNQKAGDSELDGFGISVKPWEPNAFGPDPQLIEKSLLLLIGKGLISTFNKIPHLEDTDDVPGFLGVIDVIVKNVLHFPHGHHRACTPGEPVR